MNGTPTTLPSSATPSSPLTATPEMIFLLTCHHTFNIPMYKIIACIEHTTVLWANTHEQAIIKQMKAYLAIHN